jgi:hypothetical protein
MCAPPARPLIWAAYLQNIRLGVPLLVSPFGLFWRKRGCSKSLLDNPGAFLLLSGSDICPYTIGAFCWIKFLCFLQLGALPGLGGISWTC